MFKGNNFTVASVAVFIVSSVAALTVLLPSKMAITVTKSDHLVYCSGQDYPTVWIDIECLVPLFSPSSTNPTNSTISKGRFKLFEELERCLKDDLSDDKIVNYNTIAWSGLYQNQVVAEITATLNGQSHNDRDENIRKAIQEKGIGGVCSVALAMKVMRRKMAGTRDIDRMRPPVEGILGIMMNPLKEGANLGYQITKNMSASVQPFNAMRSSVISMNPEISWAKAIIPQSQLPVMDDVAAIVFSLSELGLEKVALTIGRNIAKNLHANRRRSVTSMQGPIPSPSPSAPNASGLALVPKVNSSGLTLKERLERLGDGAQSALTKSVDKQYLVYASLQTLLLTKLRSSGSLRPMGLALDGLSSGKMQFSCCRVRGFFDIGSGQGLNAEKPNSNIQLGSVNKEKTGPNALRLPVPKTAKGPSPDALTRPSNRVTNLRIPPIRTDGVGLKEVFDTFRRSIQTRSAPGLYSASGNKSLLESQVLHTVNQLVSCRSLGVDRVLQVVSDLGGSQRKYWLWAMLSKESNRKAVLYRPDPPHVHNRQGLKVIQQNSDFALVGNITRSIRKLNGTSHQFQHTLGKVNDFKQQVVQRILKARDGELPAAIGFFREDVLQELKSAFPDTNWTDRELLSIGYGRCTAGIHTMHARWLEPAYVTHWLAHGRWSTLHSLCEMLASFDHKCKSVDLANLGGKKLHTAGTVTKQSPLGIKDAGKVVFESSTFEVIDIERQVEKDDLVGSSSDEGSDNLFRDEDSDDGDAKRQNRGKMESEKDVEKFVSQAETKYSYNVIEKLVTTLRSHEAQLQCLAYRLIMKGHLTLHVLNVIESHQHFHGGSRAEFSLTLQSDGYFSLASALSVHFASHVDEDLARMANRMGVDRVADKVGKGLLHIITLQTKSNAERQIAAYRTVQYGKKEFDYNQDEVLEQQKRTLEFLRNKFSTSSPSSAAGTMAARISASFAMQETSSFVQSGELGTFLRSIDLFDYDMTIDRASLEKEHHDRMLALEKAGLEGNSVARLVAEGLKRHHHIHTYKEFIKRIGKGISTLATTSSTTSYHYATGESFEKAMDECRLLRETEVTTTRMVEAEGALLTSSKGNHQGISSIPWRMLCSQIPCDVFGFLDSGNAIANIDNAGTASSSNSSADDSKNRSEGPGNANSMSPVGLYNHSGNTRSNSTGSAGANTSSLGNMDPNSNSMGLPNSTRVTSNASSFEEYCGKLGFVPPSMLKSVELEDLKEGKTYVRGDMALERAAKILERIRGGQGPSDSQWWRKAKELDETLRIRGVQDEVFPQELIEPFCKWSFDVQKWCEVFFAEYQVQSEFEWIIGMEGDADRVTTFETGTLQTQILRNLRENRGLVVAEMKESKDVFLILMANPAVNVIVALGLEEDDSSKAKGKHTIAEAERSEEDSFAGSSSDLLRNPNEDTTNARADGDSRSTDGRLFRFPDSPRNFVFESVINNKHPAESMLKICSFVRSTDIRVYDFGILTSKFTISEESRLQIEITDPRPTCPILQYLADIVRGTMKTPVAGEMQRVLTQLLQTRKAQSRFFRNLMNTPKNLDVDMGAKNSTIKKNHGAGANKLATNSFGIAKSARQKLANNSKAVDSIAKSAKGMVGSSSTTMGASASGATSSQVQKNQPGLSLGIASLSGGASINLVEPGTPVKSASKSLLGRGNENSAVSGNGNDMNGGNLLTNPPPDSILNDMHDAGEDVSQPTSGNVVDVEFGLDDLHAVIRNTTALQLSRLLVLAYFSAEHEDANATTIDFLLSQGCYAERQKILYYVELDNPRTLISDRIKQRLGKRRRQPENKESTESKSEGKRIRIETAKANQRILGEKGAEELGQRPKEIVEQAAPRIMRPLKKIKDILPGPATKKKQELRKKFGTDGSQQAELRKQELLFHTPGTDLLGLALKDSDRCYSILCPFCDSDDQLGVLRREWMCGQKGPTAIIKRMNFGPTVSTRRIGPDCHIQNNGADRCYCGVWLADGTLRAVSKPPEKAYFNCAHYWGAIKLNECYPSDRKCKCVYPALADLKYVARTWRARRWVSNDSGSTASNARQQA